MKTNSGPFTCLETTFVAHAAGIRSTGAGAMTPPIGDGQLGPLLPPYPLPILGASATLNGVAAPITFIGQAPTLIAGAVQVNIRIPAGTPSGNVPLVVSIGGYASQPGATIHRLDCAGKVRERLSLVGVVNHLGPGSTTN